MSDQIKLKEILFSETYQHNLEEREKLKASLSCDEWMLCLGAGVSLSAGLPSWNGLLAGLIAQLMPAEAARKYKDNEYAYYYQDIQKLYNDALGEDLWERMQDALKGNYGSAFESINTLEAAEYIRNCIENISNSEISYDKVAGKKPEELMSWYMNHYIQNTLKSKLEFDPFSEKLKNSTLHAVASLMYDGKKKRIHNVLTYNYDNLLEEYLRVGCSCKASEIHSLVKGDTLRDFGTKDDLNIYHVHGRIPVFDRPGEEMTDTVILTESDYYQEERINYSWTNVLQSYAMMRTNIIFIGFSGTDYNFRRIIKNINSETGHTLRHKIFFLIDDIVEAVFKNETKKGINLEDCIKELSKKGSTKYIYERWLINYLIHAQSIYWENYKLDVIWSSRKEIAEDLKKLL